MKYCNYKKYIYSIVFGFIVILTIALSLPVFAQFTPIQNAYLNRNELLINSDAEQGVTTWVNGSGTVSATSLDYFSGSRSFLVTLTAQTMSFCQTQNTSVNQSNASLNASCKIKTTNANIQICNKVNGVNQNCNTVANSGLWEAAKAGANFTAGTSSSGLCIISTGPITDTVKIDDCSLTQEILPSAGTIGNVLTSNGTDWFSSVIPLSINSLNGLTTTQQYFATSTTGNNFTITSSVDTHTFNLPIASSTKSGKLSNTDWSTFNSKEPAITILPVTKGGTGLATIPLNNVILGNATSPVQSVAPSTTGKALVSNGTTWISDFYDYGNLTNAPLNVSDFYNDAGYITNLGFVVGPVSSVDSQIALFDGITGKLLKAATTTGVAHLTSGVLSASNVNLSAEVVGILPIANGGTNSSTALSGSSIMVSNGTSVIQGAAGTTTTVLHGNASGAPSYSAVSLTADVSGILPTANGGTNVSAAGTVGNVLTSDGTNWISSPSGGGGGGSVNLFNSTDLTLTGGDQIALSVVTGNVIQKWRIQGNAAPIIMSTTPFLGTVADGTEIKIIGNDNTNTVEFTNNDIAGGCILNGNAILQKYYFITLVYDLALDRYIEKSRNF